MSKNDKHKTTTVGCALTKAVSGRLASIMTPMAITTAAIITPRLSTMPTAVKTASKIKIWTITSQKLVAEPAALSSCGRASNRS